jgi:hypothetical protein
LGFEIFHFVRQHAHFCSPVAPVPCVINVLESHDLPSCVAVLGGSAIGVSVADAPGSLIFLSLGNASSLLFKWRESSQMPHIPSTKLARPSGYVCAATSSSSSSDALTSFSENSRQKHETSPPVSIAAPLLSQNAMSSIFMLWFEP